MTRPRRHRDDDVACGCGGGHNECHEGKREKGGGPNASRFMGSLEGRRTKMSRDRPNMMLMKEPPTRLRELAVTDAA